MVFFNEPADGITTSQFRSRTVIVAVLGMCVSFLLSSPFDIQRFSLVRTCGKNQSSVITPWSGEFIKALKLHRVSTGSFYLRRKYAESDYALYKGRLLKEGYEKLTAFKLEGVSLEQRIMLKFFKEKKAAWQHEIKDVYFDNRLVYVEGNLPELFFVRHGSWIKQKSLNPRPAVLSITTSPSEALVFFNGEGCGESPVLLGAISGISALVDARKKDYYTMRHFVDIKQNQYNAINIRLVKKLTAERLENFDLSKYDRFDSLNLKDADIAIAELDKLLEQKAVQLEIRFQSRYPGLPPKGGQESEEDFSVRKVEYLKTREKEKEALLRFHADWIDRVKVLRQKLVRLKKRLETHMALKWFDVSHLQIGLYNVKEGTLPIMGTINRDGFHFSFEGSISVSAQHRVSVFNSLPTAQLKLLYLNKTHEFVQDSTPVKRFYDLRQLSLVFHENEYVLQGNIQLPDYIAKKVQTPRGDTSPINKTQKDSGSGPSRIETTKIGQTEKAEKTRLARLAAELALDMKAVPAGCFIMGNEEGKKIELPLHRVCIEGFQMDTYEVTQQDFIKVMGTNPSQFDECPTCPVEQVSWFQANEFCHKVGKRLPTEAEWEYACRAGSLNNYYWKKGPLNSNAWYKGNAKKTTHKVGGKKPNEWGLFDLSGNVWEWCADWYSETYYAKSPSGNPSGPETGTFKVIRGGGWASQKTEIRSSFRRRALPTDKKSNVGFRCVK